MWHERFESLAHRDQREELERAQADLERADSRSSSAALSYARSDGKERPAAFTELVRAGGAVRDARRRFGQLREKAGNPAWAE